MEPKDLKEALVVIRNLREENTNEALEENADVETKMGDWDLVRAYKLVEEDLMFWLKSTVDDLPDTIPGTYHCEDYPCCGHEWGDCDGTKYGSDEVIKQRVHDRMAEGDDDHPDDGEE